MQRKGPQQDRRAALSEQFNDTLAGREKTVTDAIEQVRMLVVEWCAEVPDASMQTRRLLALIIMAGASHGLLAATAREFDMPIGEVEDVYDQLIRSPAWRRD